MIQRVLPGGAAEKAGLHGGTQRAGYLGNMVVIDGVLHVLKKGERDTFPVSELRTSHFASCAYAKDYRKRHPS